jgi:very-short-patch-repair endonuclease
VGVERGSARCLFAAALPRPNLSAMSTPLLLRDRARRLRRDQTDAERRLWMHPRRHQLGVQFRRQHPIGPYIVDFCCVERMLIVELDGGQHGDQRARDEARTQWLTGRGFRVLRFSDREALMETEAVLTDNRNLVLSRKSAFASIS